MTTANQPTLNDKQIVELEKLAREQERSVDDVLADAVDRYIKEKQWVRSSATDAPNLANSV